MTVSNEKILVFFKEKRLCNIFIAYLFLCKDFNDRLCWSLFSYSNPLDKYVPAGKFVISHQVTLFSVFQKIPFA